MRFIKEMSASLFLPAVSPFAARHTPFVKSYCCARRGDRLERERDSGVNDTFLSFCLDIKERVAFLHLASASISALKLLFKCQWMIDEENAREWHLPLQSTEQQVDKYHNHNLFRSWYNHTLVQNLTCHGKNIWNKMIKSKKNPKSLKSFSYFTFARIFEVQIFPPKTFYRKQTVPSAISRAILNLDFLHQNIMTSTCKWNFPLLKIEIFRKFRQILGQEW